MKFVRLNVRNIIFLVILEFVIRVRKIYYCEKVCIESLFLRGGIMRIFCRYF